MSRTRPLRPAKPCDAFPHGEWQNWREHVTDVDIEAVFAAAIAETLNRLLDERRDRGESLRDLARTADVGSSTLSRLARCTVYPMIGAIARLEVALGVRLWPTQEVLWHRQKRSAHPSINATTAA